MSSLYFINIYIRRLSNSCFVGVLQLEICQVYINSVE